MKLSPTVPFMPGETPESFVSRLARINRIASSRAFCTDVGLSYQAILAGKHDALAHVADLVGISPEPLLREAFAKAGPVWTLRGQTLATWSMAPDARRVCPACLVEDESRSDLPDGVAPYFRTIWRVAHIRSCPTHACPLFELPKVADHSASRDFAFFIEPHLEHLKIKGADERELPPSPFEAYLLGRLNGAGQQFPWLEAMPFHVAAQACEVVGGVVAIGRRARRKFIGEAERRRAGIAGFEILSGGPEALARLLDELRRTAPAGKNGPTAWFGDIYSWIHEGGRHKAVQPLRDVLVRYLVDTTPMRIGDHILGETIEAPRLHSVRTVELDTGLHAQTVKRLLTDAGRLSSSEKSSPGEMLFEAGTAGDLLRRLQGSLLQRQLLMLLGLNRRHGKDFLASMHLEPIVPKSRKMAGLPRYAREDVEHLLSRLRGHAPDNDEPMPGSVDLIAAARHANAPIDRLIGHVLDGQIVCNGWSSKGLGLKAIFVDLAAAKEACRGPELNGLVRAEIQRRLGVTSYTVDALIKAGLLPTARRPHPVKRYPVTVVPTDAIEHFEQTYVKLHEAAASMGLHPRRAKADFGRAGAVPVLAGGGKIATFYRRIDVAQPPVLTTSVS